MAELSLLCVCPGERRVQVVEWVAEFGDPSHCVHFAFVCCLWLKFTFTGSATRTVDFLSFTARQASNSVPRTFSLFPNELPLFQLVLFISSTDIN